MSLIELRNVKKDYSLGKTTIHAVRGIDLTVERGELVSVVGPSGCGKTTVLNIMGSIDRPSEGAVILAGHDVAELSDAQQADIRLRRVGFIFQTFNLVPVLSVAENIELPMILAHAPKRKRREAVTHLIDAVGLSPYADHKPNELSGGQRQRVAIARALVNAPDIVIADEPTANLDSVTGDEVLQIIRNLNREEKVTFVFSTHNPGILRYATRIVKLKDGVVVGTEEREAG